METATKTNAKMKVDIWSDIMCPFCYIGKRKFEAALAQFERANDVEEIKEDAVCKPDGACD